MSCEQKQTQNPKKMFKNFTLCLKTEQNTEMSDEEHSDSEFHYPEEQEMAERKASCRGRHFYIVEVSGDTGMKRYVIKSAM